MSRIFLLSLLLLTTLLYSSEDENSQISLTYWELENLKQVEESLAKSDEEFLCTYNLINCSSNSQIFDIKLINLLRQLRPDLEYVQLNQISGDEVIKHLLGFKKIHKIRLSPGFKITEEVLNYLSQFSESPEIIITRDYADRFHRPKNSEYLKVDIDNLCLLIKNISGLCLRVKGIDNLPPEIQQSLSASPNIHSLKLLDCNLSQGLLESIVKLRSLRKLVICGSNGQILPLNENTSFSDLINLNQLILKGISIPKNNLSFLDNLPTLRKLYLIDCLCNSSEDLILPENLPLLEDLYIENCSAPMYFYVRDSLKTYPNLLHLSLLNLHDSMHLAEDDLEVFSYLPKLRTLKMPLRKMTSRTPLSFLRHLPNLELLELSQCLDISNDSLNAILYCSKLKTLVIKESYAITNEGLARLTLLDNLECLALQNVHNVTPSGVIPFYLHPNIKSVQLRYLDLWEANTWALIKDREKGNQILEYLNPIDPVYFPFIKSPQTLELNEY